MKIQLESTSKIVEFNGVPARVWEGQTESGIRVHAYMTRIAVNKDEDTSEFEKELQEHKPPTPEIQAIPIRMII